MATMISVC